ncbi:hypothetical protein OHC33_004544 [Knufia fluminis]|uniref:UBA domain-containing protein n=1 Tax=Knufia fluminis TaxID=191047 RepID=A0AAN8EMN5_9EURO|nr:hypothetical protein OHC33_004544 [Knufia fluminis]
MVSLQTLPTVERLDSDDFLNMFDSPYVSSPEEPDVPESKSHIARAVPTELSAAQTTSQFAELHGTPTQRFELGPSTTMQARSRLAKAPIREKAEDIEVGYRSSVSSSNPSTKRSHTSSPRSRKSSMTSMSEDASSSEKSSRESDKENALYERLKRRSRDKRVSFRNRHTTFGAGEAGLLRLRARSETHLPGLQSNQLAEPQEAPPVPILADTSPTRPTSRGTRLGNAMAGGLALSTPTTPTHLNVEAERPCPPELPRMSSKRVRRRTAPTPTTCAIPPPQIDDIDRIRVGIMSSLDSVDDLRNCAQVSKDFYLTFQKYETLLVDCVLRHQSPAAWDLRYSVRHLEKPSPFRLRSVQRDLSTIHALEDFIVWRCESILRPQTLEALLGEAPRRKAELEDALWTIWTFCNVFGKTSMSDATLSKQTKWLNGNTTKQSTASQDIETCREPCTTTQLEDMSEMWRCLEMLLSGFKGHEEEARKAGLFEAAGETKATDRQLLSLWIYDILSLGPKAVLTLSSCDFEQAKVLGITRWKPPAQGKSRSNFLKAAVEEVYRDRLVKEARQKALDYRKSVQYNHRRSHSDPQRAGTILTSRPPVPQNKTFPLKLDTHRVSQQPMPVQAYPSIEERIEIRPDCDPLSPVAQTPVFSPSTNPGVFSPLAMTKNASTKLGATLFPMQNRDQSHRLSVPLAPAIRDDSETDSRSIADVIDPTDQAVALMVQEMGFSEAESKRALAMSDTGSGINVERAVEILAAGGAALPLPRHVQVSELPASTGEAKLARMPSRKEVCEGHCKPMLFVEPRRDRVSGLGMVKRGLTYRMSFRNTKSSRLSVIPDDDESSPSGSNNASRSNTIRSSALSNLASSAVSAFTSPILPTSVSSKGVEHKEDVTVTALPDHSPVSPVTPTAHESKSDIHYASASQEQLEGSSLSYANMPKPRITLQRVGTGMKKTSWNIPGRKKKETNVQPEIIGYAY